jgi:protein-tyrosine-phosphatase
MAAGLMKHFYGHSVYVASCGVKPSDADPFVKVVMEEIGIDIGKHRPQGFDDLEDSSFDTVITLSPEAHMALEMTRTMAIAAEYRPTLTHRGAGQPRTDPTATARAMADEAHPPALLGAASGV